MISAQLEQIIVTRTVQIKGCGANPGDLVSAFLFDESGGVNYQSTNASSSGSFDLSITMAGRPQPREINNVVKYGDVLVGSVVSPIT